MPLGDGREAGYGLMALVASTVLGDDHRAAARQLLDAILARQLPSGQWQAWSEAMPNQPFTLNYMNGLLMEGLVLYDRLLGDGRILPALQRGIAWIWSTQWLPSQQCFQYGNINAGTIDTSPAPVLNGLLLPAWAHVYATTGDAAVLAQGQSIFKGLVDAGIPNILSAKTYDQVFRAAMYLAVPPPS
jgi:hypothetical protein